VGRETTRIRFCEVDVTAFVHRQRKTVTCNASKYDARVGCLSRLIGAVIIASALVSCAAVSGLDQYSDCAEDCGVGADSSGRRNDASGDGPSDAITAIDATTDSGLDVTVDTSADVIDVGDDGGDAGDAIGDVGSDVTSDAGDTGADSPMCTPVTSAGTGSYACATPSPAPVCDSSHNYCLCTTDSQCNSHGLNNGGCNTTRCDGGSGTCTGAGAVDNAGCSAVFPTCNLNPAGCPANTLCVGGLTSGWYGVPGPCSSSYQCCWCTSDSACSVSGKCINDATQKNCMGKGPCTGTGTNFDAMHCQLTSPGIPMCAPTYSCAKGNCDDVTSPAGTCSAAGTPCWCTNDSQCTSPSHKCVSWAGCAGGACTGSGTPDCFHCAP
jgi:hypothetical protein